MLQDVDIGIVGVMTSQHNQPQKEPDAKTTADSSCASRVGSLYWPNVA